MRQIELVFMKHWSNKVLVFLFDGMQSAKFEEFLRDNPNSTFNQVINDGIKAEYMIPSFSTLTFSNHYTLATGLYISFRKILFKNLFIKGLNVENHGITGTSFFDPQADIKVNKMILGKMCCYCCCQSYKWQI